MLFAWHPFERISVAKSILIFVIGGLFCSAAGFALGIFVYPFIFLSDIVATEKVENLVLKRVLATGTFVHANPSDPIHHGKGRVTEIGRAHV